MKKITYSLLLFVVLSFVYSSCKDEALDPLQQDKILKGKLLVLRGDQLQKVYFDGKPGAEVFPKIATGTENFAFEAEYLSEDPSSLQSVDIFVLQKTSPTATPVRLLMKTVPFSEFKNDGKYPRPWVSVTMKFTDILTKLGIDNTFTNGKLSPATVNKLLTSYKNGIGIESDLNLTDGSKAPAENVVAAGLFQSNQFYPAQILNYAMTDYCSYDPDSWAGKTYKSVESPGSTEDNKMRKDPTVANRFIIDNWWGDGVDVYMDFKVSSNPATQTIVIPKQTTSEGGEASGTGTYSQCVGTISLTCKYVLGGATYEFTYKLTPL
ncbi:MAG: hypothetical protein ACKVOQ_20205 [Cyclobacteriaceae bacterium]